MPTPRGADRLFTLGVLGLVGLFALRAAALAALPFTVEYGEGTTWSYAELLATRGSYFLPIDSEPWIHGTYPPLFPLLQRMLGGSLAAGRLLALGATLLGALAIRSLLLAAGLARRRALLWSGLFLGLPAVHEWAATCRVDTLALGLSLAGVALAVRLGARRAVLWCAPILAAALLAKQVALAAPAAVLLGLWLQGERRRAAEFAGLYAAIVLVVMGLLQWRSGGEALRHLVTHAGFVGWHLGPFVRHAARFAFAFPVLLPLGLYALPRLGRSVTGLYALLALLTLLLAGKPGAAANYLLEPSAGVLLLAAVAAERRLAEAGPGSDRQRDFSLLLVVQLVILCQPGRPFEVIDLLRARQRSAPLVEALRRAQGPVLAEDLGLTLAAKQKPMLEPFQFGLLARAGRFDPRPVLEDLRARRFGLVAAGARLTAIPGLSQALEESYRRDGEMDGLVLWRPRHSAGK